MCRDSEAFVSPWTIFRAYSRLGCTSFGGPIAHLGYFHEEFVVRRRWVDETTYTGVVGLCQFLPGPASSQVGFTIGLLRGGTWYALAAWAAFTLPSALLMFAVASGHTMFSTRVGSGVVHARELVAVRLSTPDQIPVQIQQRKFLDFDMDAYNRSKLNSDKSQRMGSSQEVGTHETNSG